MVTLDVGKVGILPHGHGDKLAILKLLEAHLLPKPIRLANTLV